jgi:hypothetical protein
MSQPPLITDASPSADEQQSRRRRTYSIIMIVHIVGFAASYPCYLWKPWAGAVVIGLTGLLPWVAVILANDAPRRSDRRRSVGPLRRGPRARYGPPVLPPRSPS